MPVRSSGLAMAGRALRAAAVLAALLALPAFGQSGAPRLSPIRGALAPMSETQMVDFLAAARPMQAVVDPSGTTFGAVEAIPTTESGPAAISPGAPGRPVRSMVDEAEYRDLTAGSAIAPASGAATGGRNHGVGLEDTPYQFNDYLQFPSPYYAPYRSVGRLVFMASDGLVYWCTASLINRAVIVTAGHCVFDGGANSDTGFNQDGYFYPGYSAADGASQRYGRCRVQRWGTTEGWYTTGDLNGGYDVGVALCGVIEDARWTYVNNWLPGHRLGYLGFCYENCRTPYRFLTQLGYPANYYSGGEMTVGQHLEISGDPIPNIPSEIGLDFVFGSGMQGGSSGGPHIANIGELSDSAADAGEYADRNVIFAVTSWGFNAPIYKIQGASPLSGVENGNDFRSLFNAMCRASRRLHGRASCRSLP